MTPHENSILLCGFILASKRPLPDAIQSVINQIIAPPQKVSMESIVEELGGMVEKRLAGVVGHTMQATPTGAEIDKLMGEGEPEIITDSPPCKPLAEKPKRLRDDSLDEVLELCAKPMAMVDIATIFNCTKQTVKNYLTMKGVDLATLGNFGMKTSNRKPQRPKTPEEIARLRAQCAAMREKRLGKKQPAPDPAAEFHLEDDQEDITEAELEDDDLPDPVNGLTEDEEESEYSPEPPPAKKPFIEVPIDRLQTVHNETIGVREFDTRGILLKPDDWPDIKKRLDVKGHSITSIAHDYDVDFDAMDKFIRDQRFKEKVQAQAASEGEPEPGE